MVVIGKTTIFASLFESWQTERHKNGSGYGLHRTEHSNTAKISVSVETTKILGNKFGNMRKTIGYKDFMDIRPGETKTFQCDTIGQLISTKVTAYSMRKKHPRTDVERYKLSVNWEQLLLTVTAIPTDDEK